MRLEPAASAVWGTAAGDGQARAVVVTPPSPAPAVATAARELTNYLHQITGAEFQIATAPVQGLATIRVGEPFQGKMPDEVFAKVRDARTLTVTGEGTRGPLYAVYRLLEHFGVGFWAPDNESVPHQASLSLPDDFELAEAPCFEYRQPYSDSAYGPAWNAKVGINGDIWAKALPPCIVLEQRIMKDKRLKVVVAGLGFGRAFVPVWLDHPDVYAVDVIETHQERLKWTLDKNPRVNHVWGSLEEALKDDSVDAVHLLTPIPLHVEQSVATLRAGKHCACAVPAATSIEGLREIVKAERESGRNYMDDVVEADAPVVEQADGVRVRVG